MNLLRWAAALCAAALVTPASARPFTLDDLLHTELPGQVNIDPTGRWLIHDTQPAHIDAPRFDDDVNTRPLHSHLLRVDLRQPGRAIPAFDQKADGGYLPGPFSPDGRYLAVFRNLNRRWDLGILEIATRKVRWLGFGVDLADKGDTLAWRSPGHLVALRLAAGERYWKEELQQAAMARLPALWAKAATGHEATAITIGSGRYIDEHWRDGPRRLVDVDAASGRVRTYSAGAFDSLSVSANGRYVAVIEAAGRVRLSGEQLLGAGTQLRRAALAVVDLTTGAFSKPCDAEPLVSSLRWSPTTQSLLLYARPMGSDDWNTGAYRRVEPNGSCAALETPGLVAHASIEGDSGFARAHVEWLDGAPAVQQTSGDGGRQDWFRLTPTGPVNLTAGLKDPPGDPILAGAHHLLFRQGGAVFSVAQDGESSPPMAEGVTRILAPHKSYASVPLPLDGAARLPVLYAVAEAGDHTALWRLSETVATPLGQIVRAAQPNYTGSEAGLVTLTTDPHGETRLELHPRTGPSVLLADANRRLAAVDIPAPIAVEHTGPDGQSLKSWLYLPAGIGRSKPPLIVFAYPGFYTPDPPFYGVPGAQVNINAPPLLAAAYGYAVLVPAMPRPEGSTSPGLTFAKEMDHVLDAVAKTGLVDVDRLGYWGHSYGGYAGLMLASETDRFKAIVVASPTSNMMAMRGVGSSAAWLTSSDQEAGQEFAGWTELGQAHLMATPWTEPKRFVDNSPVFRADKIHTPILLLQGDQDVMGITGSREMFNALYRLGKDARFITFYGEGHNVVGPANMRVYLDALFGFMDQHLKPTRSAAVTAAGPSPQAPSAAPKPRSRRRKEARRMSHSG